MAFAVSVLWSGCYFHEWCLIKINLVTFSSVSNSKTPYAHSSRSFFQETLVLQNSLQCLCVMMCWKNIGHDVGKGLTIRRGRNVRDWDVCHHLTGPRHRDWFDLQEWKVNVRKKGDLQTVSYHTSDCMVEEVQVYVLHHDLLCECWLCSDRSWNVTRWWFHQVTNKTLVGPNQYDMAIFRLEGSFVFWIIYIWLLRAKCPHWWQLNLNVK